MTIVNMVGGGGEGGEYTLAGMTPYDGNPPRNYIELSNTSTASFISTSSQKRYYSSMSACAIYENEDERVLIPKFDVQTSTTYYTYVTPEQLDAMPVNKETGILYYSKNPPEYFGITKEGTIDGVIFLGSTTGFDTVPPVTVDMAVVKGLPFTIDGTNLVVDLSSMYNKTYADLIRPYPSGRWGVYTGSYNGNNIRLMLGVTAIHQKK